MTQALEGNNRHAAERDDDNLQPFGSLKPPIHSFFLFFFFIPGGGVHAEEKKVKQSR